MKLLSLFVTALANQSEDRKFTNDNEFMSQDTPAWWLNKSAVERLSTFRTSAFLSRKFDFQTYFSNAQ